MKYSINVLRYYRWHLLISVYYLCSVFILKNVAKIKNVKNVLRIWRPISQSCRIWMISQLKKY